MKRLILIVAMICTGCSKQFAVQCDSKSSLSMNGMSEGLGEVSTVQFFVDRSKNTVAKIVGASDGPLKTQDTMRALISGSHISADEDTGDSRARIEIDLNSGDGSEMVGVSSAAYAGTISSDLANCKKIGVPTRLQVDA